MNTAQRANLGGYKQRGCFIYMVLVKKMPGDSDDALIRKFSRKVMAEGILQEAKRREFYLKPSLARKQKKEDARRAKQRSFYGA